MSRRSGSSAGSWPPRSGSWRPDHPSTLATQREIAGCWLRGVSVSRRREFREVLAAEERVLGPTTPAQQEIAPP
jgi:hypothetical protein